ncbi:phosphotransferase family protein [Streptomyces sp. NPDC088910]|uniref:phosphotransferase family protein n=1 Tax=Streptomyces sp. NPDC088910 TaxID=3365911 RepID=UPI00381A0BEB
MAPLTRDDTVTGALERAGIPAAGIAGHAPLQGGTYNAMHRVELTDGAVLVLKVPPPSRVPKLGYERELLRGEARFYEGAATAGVPAPRVVHAEYDDGSEQAAPFLLMTHCPGVTWSAAGEAAEGVGEAESARLWRETGGLLARLHSVRGPAFGYPAQTLAPLNSRWRPAFTAMTDAVLADAERYGPWLPLPVAEIRAALATAAPVLDEVTEPALVHFDLWPGNILLHGPAGARTVSGLIDGERMFWGDPLADFASLSIGRDDIERDSAFLAGYGAGGGRTDFDAAARRRIALYRCYLFLIMLVEVVPRGTGGEHLAWVRQYTGPRLEAALRTAAG